MSVRFTVWQSTMRVVDKTLDASLKEYHAHSLSWFHSMMETWEASMVYTRQISRDEKQQVVKCPEKFFHTCQTISTRTCYAPFSNVGSWVVVLKELVLVNDKEMFRSWSWTCARIQPAHVSERNERNGPSLLFFLHQNCLWRLQNHEETSITQEK
jgi:hypothetical protein